MKSTNTLAFYSDPHIQFLSQILQDIRRGELLVPRFQRPFVWLPQQQLELLRSIRQGIPIGAIMVWRTANAQIACYDTLGPFALELGRKIGVRDYLLDGVQRLSTLYGALNSPSSSAIQVADLEEEEEEEEQQIPVRIYFDLKKLDFLFLKPEEELCLHYLPLNILLDSVALLRYQRSLGQFDDSELMVEQCDHLAGAFRQYKVPIIPIATDDISLATLTFQRINSQGQKMSDYHMLHALTWSASFDLMRSLTHLRNEWLSPVGWNEIDVDPILKVLKLTLKLDVYKADIEELSKRVTADPIALTFAVNGVALAANFLKNEMAIPSHEFVPYSLQIVLLADILRKFPNLDQQQTKLLKDWFWYVTYSEAFSGISDDKVRMAHEDLISMLIARKPVWRNKNIYEGPLPIRRYDFRSARTKSFILNMARIKAIGKSSDDAMELLAEHGRRAVQPFYPPSAFSQRDRGLFNSIGNKVLCSPSSLSGMRKNAPTDSGGLFDDDLLNDSMDSATEVVYSREKRLLMIEGEFAASTAGDFARQIELV